jgi:hypothetical protein
MPIEQSILNEFKCHLHNDDHIAIEPVVLPCKLLACKKCIVDSKHLHINCFGCNMKHEKSNLLSLSIDKLAEFKIHSNLNDLNEYVDERLEKLAEELKSKIFSLLISHSKV